MLFLCLKVTKPLNITDKIKAYHNLEVFYMRTKQEGLLIVKNIFKTDDFDARKEAYNKRLENYINFCENRL